MGDTGILMLEAWMRPSPQTADEIAALIAGNMDQPARELMWGSPGTLLAALFLHGHTSEERWADLYRETARVLWAELEWSTGEGCHCWSQDMYGEHSDYIDAGHGFAGTASPLILGRHLLEPGQWRGLA